MRVSGRSAVFVSLALLCASCGQLVQRVSTDEAFTKPDPGRNPWRRVVVLPFAGDPALRRTAAEWLAFRVGKHGLFEIVGPSLAEIELRKRGFSLDDARTTVEQAREAGRLLGADGVVLGSVDSPAWNGNVPNAFHASVVDVATGKVVAARAAPGFAVFRPGQDGAAYVVDLLASDLAPVFHAAAGKAWTPPAEGTAPGRAPDNGEGAPR